MSKKQIYLHLGLHKTGTTLLQIDVFPTIREINQIARHSYERQVLDIILQSDYVTFDRRMGVVLDCFEKHYDEREKVLISHEMFSGNPFFGYNNRYPVLMKLKKMFPEAKIIVGIRSQKNMIDSLYREYIAQGGIKSFDQFVIPKIPRNKSVLGHEPHLDPETFRYGPYLDQIAELFGKENMFVYPAEKSIGVFDAFLDDLYRFFELKRPGNPQKVNESRHKSVSNFYLDVHRFFNKFHCSLFNPAGPLPFKWNLGHKLRHFEFTRVKRGGKDGKFEVTPAVDYREDNQDIDSRYNLGLKESFADFYDV